MEFNFIDSGGCSGAFNMAADLFLLNKYNNNTININGIANSGEEDYFSSRPTLRIYYFSPPALSLGFFQKYKDIEETIIEKAKYKGYDIVSRPTGGRAVLHKSEITYSITATYKNGIFAGKLIDTYKKIGEFLYLFFVKLGLKPDINDIISPVARLNGNNPYNESKNTKHTAYALEALIDGISSIKN